MIYSRSWSDLGRETEARPIFSKPVRRVRLGCSGRLWTKSRTPSRQRFGRPRLVGMLVPVGIKVGTDPQLRVFVRKDFRSGFLEHFIRAGVIQMPVGVEDRLNGLPLELI